ncbi:MAG: hypothetical protein ACYC3S_13665 [Chloroflexota bacterium]
MRVFSKIVVLALVVALLASALGAGTALAARPDGGGKTTATLAIYQDGVQVSSVAAGSTYEVKGTGFKANATIYCGLSGFFNLEPIQTDASGSFTHSDTARTVAGQYSEIGMQSGRKGSWDIVATAPFTVY